MAKNKGETAATPGRRASESWFEKLPVWKQNAFAVLLMLVLLVFLFNDIILKGMIFSDSGDTATHESWPAAMTHIRETEQVEPLWIPYIFSGMPIAGALIFPRNVNYVQDFVVATISKVLFLGSQLHWMIIPFLMMGFAMYFLARELKFSAPVSIFASLVMMLNPYAVGLPETGHGSKLIVLGYIPLALLLTYKLFQERSILMFALTAATVGTMLLADHPQMAFYGLMLLGLYLVGELVYDIRQAPKEGAMKAAFFAGALLLGFALYAYHALPTLEYASYSIRGGGGEAASGAAATGLSYEYATNWSFHPAEMINFLVPSFFGYESPFYWGWMPFTNSTVYVGLLPLIFAGVALAFRRNRMTWFLLLFSVLILFISFGKHFGVVYNLMFNYFPYFNKLRVPVMVLHVLPLSVGLLAAYGLDWMVTRFPQMKEPEIQAARKTLMRVLVGIGILTVAFLAMKDAVYGFLSGFCFTADTDMAQFRQQYGVQAQQALAQFKVMRYELLWKDALKCFILGAASVGLIMAFMQRKIGSFVFVSAVTLITIGDLWYYDVRYINPKPASAMEAQFATDETLDRLAAECAKDPFRVLDPSGQLDQHNDLMHAKIQSVEGYSPAKLKIYQDLRDSLFRSGSPAVFNMLNVKYLVSRTQGSDGRLRTSVQPNTQALPRAWFADSIVVAAPGAEVFRTLKDPAWNPRTTAVIERALPSPVSSVPDTSVRLAKYASRSIELSVEPSAAKFLVLSEIYYPAGWRAFVDGSETEIFKTNHALRGVVVPAGKHTVEFRFEPASYANGLTVTQSAWGVTLILLVVGGFLDPRVRKWLTFK